MTNDQLWSQVPDWVNFIAQDKSGAWWGFEVEPLPQTNKLLTHPKCIVGSHNGSNTIEAVIRASERAINLLYEMLKGGTSVE